MGKWISYKKEDHLALFTVHTLGHIFWGLVIGFATKGLEPVEAAYIVLGVNIGWELFEYWHAPAFGYWTVMNAGNTAMDISTWLWAFMLVNVDDWDFVWCTFALLGAVGARKARSRPYDLKHRQRWTDHEKAGSNGRMLEWFREKRASVYPKEPEDEDKRRFTLKGIKDHNAYPRLDPYMKPSNAHRALAWVCLVSLVVCYWAPREVVPALAGFTLGYAVAQPTDTTTTGELDIYHQWITNAAKPSLPPLAQLNLLF
jgi:hypothetical protein